MDVTNLALPDETHTAYTLLVALLLGALIGLQRGWVARHRQAGERIAGIRTHALVGLLGGFSALLSETLSLWVLPAMFLGLTALSLVAFWSRLQYERDFSITGLVGLLLSFTFGAVVVSVSVFLGAAGAVITALILDNKAEIHGALTKLHEQELDAGLKLLLISLVILPLLPNEGFGPGGVLNPYEIWWLVVLIAGISFVGYFAIRVAGTQRGILYTSVFAGLSSTTALTLNFARLSQQTPAVSPLLAAGVLIACGTMFPRLLIYAYLFNKALLPSLWLPVLLMGAVLYVNAALILWRAKKGMAFNESVLSRNPLDMSSALYFAVLITVILVLGQFLQQWLGESGIYTLAAVSGIADVDAITLSLTRMSLSGLTLEVAVFGIVIAASVNNLVKAGLAIGVGRRAMWQPVLVPMGISTLVGLVALWL
ncbi:MAG: MgtC/SapB family protein [Saccharospirillum sp.]